MLRLIMIMIIMGISHTHESNFILNEKELLIGVKNDLKKIAENLCIFI